MAEPTPCRVLVIGDDVGRREATGHALRAAGLAVDDAATGEAGLARVSPEIDVVIVDLQRSEVDAGEVCRRIKADPATAAVMVLAVAVSAADAGGLEDSADAYLVHPIAPAELVAAVRALYRLCQTERARQRLARHRDLLLGALSHDLRSPLQVIRLASELLRTTQSLDARQLRAIGQIDNGVDRLHKMIEQLLFFARSEADGIAVDRRPTHLPDLVAEVIRDAPARYPDRVIEVESSIDRPVSIDPDRVLQLLDNLVANALRHGTGTVTVRLAATADAAGGTTTIEVHNDGTPIPAELQPTLFDPFRQVAGRRGSAGLGLCIVDRIVTAHGGTIGVVSTPVDGTTFRISLPET